MFNKFFLTYGTPLIQQHIFQNPIFFTRQRHRFTIGTGFPLLRVESDISITKTYILLYKLSSRQASNPGFQLLEMKRLLHIIVCTCIQALYLINLASGRKNQHLCLLVFHTKFPQNIHSIHPRQVQIQYDQIVFFRQNIIQGFFTIITGINLIPGTI